ncbi:MAG: hypothetical protein L0338_33950 [Acidobacteria bacterium]|nr:hypothetical protein [Acidobacteriota bacterium]
MELMREALENQKLCDPDLDVEGTLEFAVEHPNESVVDSFASVEILSSRDEVFGTALPKSILKHKTLTTLSGLTRSLEILEARRAAVAGSAGGRKKGEQ